MLEKVQLVHAVGVHTSKRDLDWRTPVLQQRYLQLLRSVFITHLRAKYCIIECFTQRSSGARQFEETGKRYVIRKDATTCGWMYLPRHVWRRALARGGWEKISRYPSPTRLEIQRCMQRRYCPALVVTSSPAERYGAYQQLIYLHRKTRTSISLLLHTGYPFSTARLTSD